MIYTTLNHIREHHAMPLESCALVDWWEVKP